MNNKNLEKIIKEKLQQNLSVPDGFSWSDLEGGIERPVENSGQKRAIYLLFSFIILLLCIVIGSLYYQNNTVEQIMATKSGESAGLKNNSGLLNNKDNIGVAASSINETAKNKATISENLNNETPSKSIYINVATEYEAKQSINNETSEIGLSSSVILGNIRNETLQSLNGKESLIDTSEANENISDSLIKSTTNKNISSAEFISNDVGKLPTYQTFLETSSEKFENPNIGINKPSPIVSSSNWSLAFSAGVNLINYRVNSENELYRKTLMKSRTPRIGQSIELSSLYKMTDRLSIEGALGYQILREEIQFTESDTVVRVLDKGPTSVIYNVFSGNTYTNVGLRTTNEIENRTILHNNQYKLIEGSLRLSYNLYKSKFFNVDAIGGFGISKRIVSGRYINTNLRISELVESEYLSSSSISSLGILGLRFNTEINSRFILTYGFIYRRQLQDWAIDDKVNIRPSTLNFNIGLRLDLKSRKE